MNIFAFIKSGIIKQIKGKLAVVFNIVDIRPLAFYIDLKITYDYKQKKIKLLKPGYIEKLLNWHEILKAKTTKI